MRSQRIEGGAFLFSAFVAACACAYCAKQVVRPSHSRNIEQLQSINTQAVAADDPMLIEIEQHFRAFLAIVQGDLEAGSFPAKNLEGAKTSLREQMETVSRLLPEFKQRIAAQSGHAQALGPIEQRLRALVALVETESTPINPAQNAIGLIQIHLATLEQILPGLKEALTEKDGQLVKAAESIRRLAFSPASSAASSAQASPANLSTASDGGVDQSLAPLSPTLKPSAKTKKLSFGRVIDTSETEAEK
jgi:hypothetical protein